MVGFFNRLASAIDVEFSVDVIQVFFYGLGRNEQFCGDLFVAEPLL
jgi:hypothetical protein